MADADVLKCLRMLTFLPIEQIDEMDQWEGSQLNRAKEILAYELTNLVHGEEEAKKAEEAARALFAGGGSSENMPTATLTDDQFVNGSIDILGVMVAAGMASSRSEARRAVEQGGVSVKGEKVTDIKASYTKDIIGAEEFIVKKVKKSFMKIVVE